MCRAERDPPLPPAGIQATSSMRPARLPQVITARLRRAANALDSLAHDRVATEAQEVNSILAADAFLPRCVIRPRRSGWRGSSWTRPMAFMSISSTLVQGLVPTFGPALWPRMMLKRADLAAPLVIGTRRARGTPSAGPLGRRDPELQPTIARIRAGSSAEHRGARLAT